MDANAGWIERDTMRARLIAFGLVEVDGERYDRDVVIEAGRVRQRRKGPSKPFRSAFGHTPLSAAERLPWTGPRLIVGTGVEGALPVLDDVRTEAHRRGIILELLPTDDACRRIEEAGDEPVNAENSAHAPMLLITSEPGTLCSQRASAS